MFEQPNTLQQEPREQEPHDLSGLVRPASSRSASRPESDRRVSRTRTFIPVSIARPYRFMIGRTRFSSSTWLRVVSRIR